MADSNLRRVFSFVVSRSALRSFAGRCSGVPVAPAAGVAARLAPVPGSGRGRGGGGSLRRSGTGRGRFSLLLGLVRYRPPVLLEPVGALSLRRGRDSGGSGSRGGRGARRRSGLGSATLGGTVRGAVALRGLVGARERGARFGRERALPIGPGAGDWCSGCGLAVWRSSGHRAGGRVGLAGPARAP